jgi:hypothetical protein
MKSLTIAALAASTLAFAHPAGAQTVTRNPIDIQRVVTSPHLDETGVPGVVKISYENTADVPVREVTFRVRDTAGHEVNFRDVGTFAQGVTIRHDFRSRNLSDSAQAHVVHVEWADGASWNSTTPELQPRRQAAAQLDALVRGTYDRGY